jgi:Tfp pilus assembly protein PilF
LLRTAALDLADPLREYGYLVPDRLVFRAELSEDRIDLPRLLESQQPFWARMEQIAANPVDKRNPAFGYQRYALRLASKVANNLGFMQVERGNGLEAMEIFKQARRLNPDNISALLNLLTLAQAKELPEAAEYQAAWDEFKGRHVDSRVMWSLSALYGYVHNTAFLVRQGMMWAVSGKPRIAEAELRRAAGSQAVNAEVKAFLGRAYLQSGDLQRSAAFYRDVLKENPRDVQALLMLAEMSIGAEDYAEAEALLARAEEAGVAPEKLRFERTVLAYLNGQVETVLADLKEQVKQDKENVRAWALLAMLTRDGSDPETYEKALKALKGLQGASPDVRLMLAELHMSRNEWADARTELDQVTRMNPRHVRAWEMLVAVDFRERKRELAEDHVRNLLTLDPENFTGNLMLGSFQYARGQYSLAESSYRAALKARRDPSALNDLSYLLMLKGGGAAEEARSLIEEALVLQPENPVFLSTRGELNLKEGRYDEAERDLQQVLAAMPDSAQALLLSARLYAARGQKAAALDLVETLSERQEELPAEQQTQLQGLLNEMK